MPKRELSFKGRRFMDHIETICYQSPVGNMEIGYEDEQVVFVRLNTEKTASDSNAKSVFSKEIKRQFDAYFSGKRKAFDLPLKMEGTDFQKRVWEALLDIPYGETRTYKDIAIVIGNPKACRAVGMANNKNPIAIIVPCHRVIGSNGKLVGYAGGLEMKKGLLALESQNI